MADTKICFNCGAKNPFENRFCEDCGIDMKKAGGTSVSEAKLYCPNGHTVSDSSFGFCDVCGEKLTSVKPQSKEWDPIPSVEAIFAEPSYTNPSVGDVYAGKNSGKRCPICGAINPEDGVFCEECGAVLAKYTAPGSKSAEYQAVPDIPGIMRTLTNEDMKK